MSHIVNNQQLIRVFVSSTYEDMIEYRDAAISALTSIEALPIGMERFVSAPETSLEVCLSEVRRCQLFIILVGMKYGSIDEETSKSYSELEYDEAVKNGIPTLAFIIDENECPILPKFVDTGDKAEKLKRFKDILNKQYTSRFKSIDHLKELINRAVIKQITEQSNERIENKANDNNSYKEGANTFRRFILLPERYKDRTAVLRIRLDGKFGTWKVREALFKAFDLNRGDTIFCNDAVVLGIDFSDIDEQSTIDVFAEGKSADWILDNNITLGSTIEAQFKLAYEYIESSSADTQGYKKAVLIMKDGRSIINK